MKKLLAFFSAFVVTSSSTGSVVSCNNTSDGSNNDNTTENLTFEEVITSFNKVGTSEWYTENADEMSEIEKDKTKMWEWTKKYFVNPFLKILELDINNDLQSLEKVNKNDLYLSFYKANALGTTLSYLYITKDQANAEGWPWTEEQVKEYNTIYKEKNCKIYFEILQTIKRG